jgi:hypothetical protein
MKKTSKNQETLQAQQAMNRAAWKVMKRAVDANKAIPMWDGEKTVWKVPREEAEQLAGENALRPTA